MERSKRVPHTGVALVALCVCSGFDWFDRAVERRRKLGQLARYLFWPPDSVVYHSDRLWSLCLFVRC